MEMSSVCISGSKATHTKAIHWRIMGEGELV